MTGEARAVIEQLIQAVRKDEAASRSALAFTKSYIDCLHHQPAVADCPKCSIGFVASRLTDILNAADRLALADVLRSPTLQDQKNQEDTRVDSQCDPTDSPTASPVAPVSTEVEGSLKIRDALLVVIESAFSCRICGIEDGDEHPSDLHDFEAIDVVALLLDELRGIGFDIRKRRVSHSDIPALVSEIRALCDENIGKAAIWAQFGYLRSKVRQLLMRLED